MVYLTFATIIVFANCDEIPFATEKGVLSKLVPSLTAPSGRVILIGLRSKPKQNKPKLEKDQKIKSMNRYIAVFLA